MLSEDSGFPHLCKFPPHYKHHSPPNGFTLLQTPSSSTKLFKPGAPTQVEKISPPIFPTIFGCLRDFCSPQLEKRIKAKSFSNRARPRRLRLLTHPAVGRGAGAAGKTEQSWRAWAGEEGLDTGRAFFAGL